MHALTSSILQTSLIINDPWWATQCKKCIQGNLDRTIACDATQSAPPSITTKYTVDAPMDLHTQT